MGFRCVVVLALVLLGCGGDDELAPPVGSTVAVSGTSTSTATSTGSGPTGSGSSGETETDGPSALCRVCRSGACSDVFDQCLADEACACRLECDGSASCASECPESSIFADVLDCIVDSTFGPCVDPCEAECEACLVTQCASEWAACIADEVCVCRVWCRDSDACDEACGPATAANSALNACFGEANPSCVDQC